MIHSILFHSIIVSYIHFLHSYSSFIKINVLSLKNFFSHNIIFWIWVFSTVLHTLWLLFVCSLLRSIYSFLLLTRSIIGTLTELLTRSIIGTSTQLLTGWPYYWLGPILENLGTNKQTNKQTVFQNI